MYGVYDLKKNDELMHHGVKGQKWGVRRYQKKDGSRTSAGKKRDKTSRMMKDARKLSDLSSKYYDNINRYNALVDTYGSTSGDFRKTINDSKRKTDKLVRKLEKRYGSVSVVPEFEKNGYVVKSTETIIRKMDSKGREIQRSTSYNNIETYNSWRKEDAQRVKQIKKTESEYRKKLKSAKSKDDRELLELELEEKLDF